MDELIFIRIWFAVLIIIYICAIISWPIRIYIQINKYFPYNTKELLSSIKQKPEKIFLAAGKISFFKLKGPFLKIRLYNEFIIINTFNRAIQVNYIDGEIIKGVFSTGFKFLKNNKEYYIYLYSAEAIQFLINKIKNAQYKNVQEIKAQNNII